MERNNATNPFHAEVEFRSVPVDYRKRTLEIGNTLKRKRKGFPHERARPWSIVRDLIVAAPNEDSTEYVAVLCEGVDELAGRWFIWRTYFTNNRHGKRAFGQFGPQAPINVDKWLSDQICQRNWYQHME